MNVIIIKSCVITIATKSRKKSTYIRVDRLNYSENKAIISGQIYYFEDETFTQGINYADEAFILDTNRHSFEHSFLETLFVKLTIKKW